MDRGKSDGASIIVQRNGTIEMAEKKRVARKNGQTELYKPLKKEIKSKIIEDIKDYGLKMSAKRSKNLTETTNQSYSLKR